MDARTEMHSVYLFRWEDGCITFSWHNTFTYWLCLQNVVRGRARDHGNGLPDPKWEEKKRLVWAATAPNVSVSYLPASMFGNAYT